jgi:hypothetical protein
MNADTPPRPSPDTAGRLALIEDRLAALLVACRINPTYRVGGEVLLDTGYLLALARRQAKALRWTEAKRTGPCLFCGTELFRPHGADCELGKLLAEVEP